MHRGSEKMKNSKLSKFLIEKLAPAASKFANNKYVKAITQGMVANISLSIVGGISLLIASPPVNPDVIQPTNLLYKFLLAWYNFASTYNKEIMTPFFMTMGIKSIFIAMGVAYRLAEEYKDDFDVNPFTSAVTAAVTFLMVAAGTEDGAIPMRYLDTKGLFSAMLIGVGTVEVTKFLIKNNIRIKMPAGVPPAVSASFTALIPMFINVVIFYGMNLVLVKQFDVSFPQLVFDLLTPMMEGADSVWFIAITMFLTSLLWAVGIHGGAVVSSVTGVVYSTNLMANATAKAAGEPMKFILAGQVPPFLVVLGGAGATLALNVLMLRSESERLKAVGRIGFVPSLFGINEPILFGTPMILNPIMSIPFIFVPVVNSFLAFYAIKWGLMGKLFITVPWTMPPFIGIVLATMDIKAAFVVFFILFIDLILYYPFFKLYERQLLAEEHGVTFEEELKDVERQKESQVARGTEATVTTN